MGEETLGILTPEDLDEIAPLLSEESYRNIKSEIKQLNLYPPRANGLGVEHMNYIPRTFEECKIKVEKLKERYGWSRQLNVLSEMIIVDRNREIRFLKKENRELKDENAKLKNDVKRLLNQLRRSLGIKTETSTKKKVEKNQEDGEKKTNRKRRGAPKGHIGRTRPIPDHVNNTKEILPPGRCPKCSSTAILFSDESINKYIEDILPITKYVEEIKYRWGICADCSQKIIDQEAFNGPPVKIGDNLISMLTVMRQQMGISYRKLSRLSTEMLKIPLTPSGVLGITNRVSQKLEPIYKGIEASLQNMPVLYGDETGWRMDGKRWYMWCFCNKKIVFYHADNSRGSKVPKAILGNDYDGILHADFYSSYNFIEKTQRCLVHFLRTIKEELEVSPNDKALLQLKIGLKNIIKEGNRIKLLPVSSEKQEQKKQLENELAELTKLESENKKVKTFGKRIIRHQKDLLRFVDHPEVDYHNNWVEQIIRWVVIFRKLSFGNRTVEGAFNFSILATVLETLRLQEKNLLESVLEILRTPSDRLNRITRSLLDTS